MWGFMCRESFYSLVLVMCGMADLLCTKGKGGDYR